MTNMNNNKSPFPRKSDVSMKKVNSNIDLSRKNSIKKLPENTLQRNLSKKSKNIYDKYIYL
jgi:hypothetical protein